MKKTKILLVHNIVAPYRLPLFEEIASFTDLTVAYIQRKDVSRVWNQDNYSKNYYSFFLNSVQNSFLGKNFSYLKAIPKNIILKDYDLIILPDDPTYLICVLQFIFYHKRYKSSSKLVFWTGNFSFYKPFESKFLNFVTNYFLYFIRKFMYKQIDLFWCYSLNTEKLLNKKFNISKEKLFTGLQGYPDILVKKPKNINFLDRHKKNTLIFLGYISPRKGINLLIDVFNDLIFNDKLNIKLEIIGNKSEYLNSLSINNKNIKFHGYLDSNDKFNALNKCKVLILPSYSDPWGWVVNEAMSIGLPVILTDGVMSKEMITDQNLISKIGDRESLKKSIKYLLDLNVDSYVGLSNDCIEQSQKHNLGKSITSFKNLINNV